METVQRARKAQADGPIAGFRGTVIEPAHAAYDEARTLYITGFDRRPRLIARPADATDVARVVSFAAGHELELAVRGGGHSIAGHSAVDGGIVLDMSGLSDLAIDAGRRTAWAGGGVTAGAYTREAAAHGLATPFGDAPTVGVAGIALGGGVGLLHRRHGLTIDNLLAAEVVTADGAILHVDETSHPDLFWAIRGGGGNFGVVTRLKFRLAPVSTVMGGMLILPATPAVLATFMAEAEAAPEGLSGVIAVLNAPPMPFLPAAAHGRPIIMALMVHDGSIEAGERAFAPFRSLAKPLADMVRPISLPEIYEGHDGPHPVAVSFRSFFMDGFDLAAAETALAALDTGTAPMSVLQLRVLGGAVARVPAEATAFAHRGRRIMAAAAAMYEDRAAAPVHDAWATGLAASLQHGEPAAYVNFLGDEGADRVRAAYPGATWDRLRAVKATYDPRNVFRLNQNIPPAADPT